MEVEVQREQGVRGRGGKQTQIITKQRRHVGSADTPKPRLNSVFVHKGICTLIQLHQQIIPCVLQVSQAMKGEGLAA